MTTVAIIFWTMLVIASYVYAGYPMLLAAATGRKSASRWRSESEDAATDGDSLPLVTFLISAYNEADCIAQKLDNTLGLNYPRQRLEVIVISDASDDGTDAIVERYASQGVRLLRMPQRSGKTAGLNAAVRESSGKFIVFSDANALYEAGSIRALTCPFADATVGAVIGESKYTVPDSDSARSESLYWRYEVWIKKMESRSGSVVGGDGAICAVRRNLYEPMAPDALSDFVNPLQVVKAGFRCVYQDKAVSYEEAAADFAREYRRKVRIVNRAWRALWSMRELLNPLVYGGFAIKLWSHKVLRWWVPAALVCMFICNLALVFSDHQIYYATLLLQLVFYALSGIGFIFRHRNVQPAFLRIPLYFCLVNIAAAAGLLQALRGTVYTTWTPARAGR